MSPSRSVLKNVYQPIPQGGLFARAALGHSSLVGVPIQVQTVLESSGQPLEPGMRALMEPHFGHDFSQVRIHADDQAARSAKAIHALAYTLGHDIVFGKDQYAPETDRGRRLMMHELAHVVQQSSASDSDLPLTVGMHGNDQHEQAAQAVADGVIPAESLRVINGSAATGLQRAEDTGKSEAADACAKQENDPESFSIMAAKHFLTEVDPSASQLAKSVHCEVSPSDPQRMECDVTFSDGQTIHVTWIKNLNNVEAQRPTPDGRQWCVYHYVCDPSGEVRYEKKGCSSNVGTKPSGSASPTLVGASAGVSGGGNRG